MTPLRWCGCGSKKFGSSEYIMTRPPSTTEVGTFRHLKSESTKYISNKILLDQYFARESVINRLAWTYLLFSETKQEIISCHKKLLVPNQN